MSPNRDDNDGPHNPMYIPSPMEHHRTSPDGPQNGRAYNDQQLATVPTDIDSWEHSTAVAMRVTKAHTWRAKILKISPMAVATQVIGQHHTGGREGQVRVPKKQLHDTINVGIDSNNLQMGRNGVYLDLVILGICSTL